MLSDYPQLEKLFPDYSVLFTSNGTCAFYLALKSIEVMYGAGEVIIPSTICPSIPLAALQAGFSVRFCDVDQETFCLSLETVKPHVNKHTRAILVAYLFGKSVDIQEIAEYADKKRITIIEDIAQAIGGKLKNKFLGSFGDMTILSFNPKKIFGKTNAGCLLFKDKTHFLTASVLERDLPLIPDESTLSNMKQEFRNMTMEYYEISRSKKYLVPTLAFTNLLKYYSPAFIFSSMLTMEAKQALDSELSNVETVRNARYTNYELYQLHLASYINTVKFTSDEMIWRLPVLLPSRKCQLSAIYNLRKAGYLISDHYFPMSVFMGQKHCPNAELIGQNAINLWVDHTVSRDIIVNSSQLLNLLIREETQVDSY